MTATTDARALRHPVWLASLGLLVVNDHLLKGAGILDGAWTGKLSDVAGMIVAPVLVSALLGARDRRRRGIAFALVAGWFTASNLFPAVAEATASVGAALGLPWSFVCDPTDLIALAALPLAWHVAEHRGPLAPRRWLERSAVGFGVAACLASPAPPDPTWTTEAWLVNETGRAIEVRVRYVEVSMDCDAIRGREAEILARESFAPATVFTVGVDETLPFQRGLEDGATDPFGPGRGGFPPPPDAGPPEWSPTNIGTCEAFILRVEGLPEEVLVVTRGLGTTTVPELVEDDADRRAVASGLHLRLAEDADEEGALELTAGSTSYELLGLEETYAGGESCRDYGAIQGFAWSNLEWARLSGTATTPARIVSVRPTLDDCLDVTFEDRAGAEHQSFICVPPADFPFLRNNEVSIRAEASRLHITRDLALEDGTSWRTGELLVVRGVGRLVEGPFTVELTTTDASCGGVRMECGGFRVPSAAGMRIDAGSTRFVHPGEAVERRAPDGREARLRVGRAERMFTTQPACGAGRDELGPRLEALVVYGEEPR